MTRPPLAHEQRRAEIYLVVEPVVHEMAPGFKARPAAARWHRRHHWPEPAGPQHPPGTVAYEFNGALPDPARFKAKGGVSMPPLQPLKTPIEVKARKSGAGGGGTIEHLPSHQPFIHAFRPHLTALSRRTP